MDRRAFIGQSAAATFALVRAGTAAETQPATPPRLKNARPGLGVIGFRYQGSVIAERAKPYGDIVAIADADKAVLDLSLVDKKVTQQVKATPEESRCCSCPSPCRCCSSRRTSSCSSS